MDLDFALKIYYSFMAGVLLWALTLAGVASYNSFKTTKMTETFRVEMYQKCVDRIFDDIDPLLLRPEVPYLKICYEITRQPTNITS